ncbi:MucBP domain-containing protein [Leuconostoc gelidum subsp. gelidum]|uniref:MucBP domain-containing protein n=1 Tax=Leuconostoc gelidum TaxID=1244 RepID=UPI001CC3A0A4|nr:MucBP domain-containing protein [Leuconostoc gelidum]MBZ6014548.1 MucBP domain-containing protein [Leuconostoc gelidum subsp. gelidum]
MFKKIITLCGVSIILSTFVSVPVTFASEKNKINEVSASSSSNMSSKLMANETNVRVASISGTIVNPKDYYTSTDVVDYQVTFSPTVKKPLLKGDTLTLSFSGDSRPFSSVKLDNGFNGYFDVNADSTNKTIVLTAKKDIKFTGNESVVGHIDIIPTRADENIDPAVGTYNFTSVFSTQNESPIDLGTQTYKVKNNKEAPIRSLACGTYAASVWGTKPASKYLDNYIGGGIGDSNGIYQYTQPIQTFSGGVVNALAPGNIASAVITVTSTNPIDEDTITLWDGMQGSLINVTKNEDYQCELSDDKKTLTIAGGSMNTLDGGGHAFAYNFSVITPEDNNAKTTVTQSTLGNLNGVQFQYHTVTNTAEYQKTDNGKFLPILSSNDFVGNAFSEDTNAVVDNPTTLIKEASDYTDGTLAPDKVPYTLNGSESSDVNDKDKLAAFKKSTPGVYYVHFKATNSSGNSATSVSNVTINASESGIVHVRYVDQLDRDIAPREDLSGYIGETYSTDPIEVNQYTLRKTPDNATGEYTNKTQEVKYVYTHDMSLSVPENVDFGTYKLGSSNPVLPWKETNVVKVLDDGNRSWQLTATLKNQSKDFEKYLSYKNKDLDTAVEISNGTSTDENVAEQLSANGGLQVNYANVNIIRKDKGELQWDLTPDISKEVQE